MSARRTRAVAVLAVAVATCIAIVVTPRVVSSHELTESSATIVIRDGGHVELRLQVPWATILQRASMPKVPMQEALARITAQSSADFARELSRVERTIEDGLRLVPNTENGVTFTRWQWPRAEDVRAALKTELMSRLAVGQAFEHASRLPASAQIALGREIATVRLVTPAVLGPTLLTAYHPTEQWIAPGGMSAAIGVKRSMP